MAPASAIPTQAQTPGRGHALGSTGHCSPTQGAGVVRCAWRSDGNSTPAKRTAAAADGPAVTALLPTATTVRALAPPLRTNSRQCASSAILCWRFWRFSSNAWTIAASSSGGISGNHRDGGSRTVPVLRSCAAGGSCPVSVQERDE